MTRPVFMGYEHLPCIADKTEMSIYSDRRLGVSDGVVIEWVYAAQPTPSLYHGGEVHPLTTHAIRHRRYGQIQNWMTDIASAYRKVSIPESLFHLISNHKNHETQP